MTRNVGGRAKITEMVEKVVKTDGLEVGFIF